MSNEPMSDERLAEIREDWASGYAFRIEDQELVTQHHAAITDLLAEVERLRAREAALAEIAEAVATRTEVWRNDCEENALECPLL